MPCSDWLPIQARLPTREVCSTVPVQYAQLSAGSATAPTTAQAANAAAARAASFGRPAIRRYTTNSSGVSLIAAATPTSTPRYRAGVSPTASTSASSTTKKLICPNRRLLCAGAETSTTHATAATATRPPPNAPFTDAATAATAATDSTSHSTCSAPSGRTVSGRSSTIANGG
jgi:hypothetical protein